MLSSAPHWVAWVLRHSTASMGMPLFRVAVAQSPALGTGSSPFFPFTSFPGGKPYLLPKKKRPDLRELAEIQKIPLLCFPLRWILLTVKQRRDLNLDRGQGRVTLQVTEDWHQANCRRGPWCKGKTLPFTVIFEWYILYLLMM